MILNKYFLEPPSSTNTTTTLPPTHCPKLVTQTTDTAHHGIQIHDASHRRYSTDFHNATTKT